MNGFPIIPRSKLRLSLGLFAMGGALFLFFSYINFSIQFTGGMEVAVDGDVTEETLVAIGDKLDVLTDETYTITEGKKDSYDSVLIQTRISDNEKVSEMADVVQDTLLSTGVISSKDKILELSIIGPSIGDYIKKSAVNAILWGTILMAIYILFSFSGMRKVISPLLLAFVTILTMLFDVSIASGAYGLLMATNSAIQVDTIFIIALLTVMGYSINDTIVIFDRIRENTMEYVSAVEEYEEAGSKKKKKITLPSYNRLNVFETSIRQTMRRSVATSVSTLLVVGCMYVFGTGILKMFAFTLGMGVLAGTYSSIFVAAPLAYLLSGGEKSLNLITEEE